MFLFSHPIRWPGYKHKQVNACDQQGGSEERVGVEIVHPA